MAVQGRVYKRGSVYERGSASMSSLRFPCHLICAHLIHSYSLWPRAAAITYITYLSGQQFILLLAVNIQYLRQEGLRVV
jgi:hypothetical protein